MGTLGKVLGVNGEFVLGSPTLIEFLKQKGDTYIYTNPISPAEAAAALAAVELLGQAAVQQSLLQLEHRRLQFRKGLSLESIPGPHPIVPILTRASIKSIRLVEHLFCQGILATALSFPVVPKNESCVRIQLHAGMSEADIAYMLEQINQFKN